MLRANVLPSGLLVLLLSCVALAEERTTPNDLFREVAKHARRAPVLPVCCLEPQPSGEPVEEIEILSFEDWKARQALARDGVGVSTGAGSEGTARPTMQDGHGERQGVGVGVGSGHDPSARAAHDFPGAARVHGSQSSPPVMLDGTTGENGSSSGAEDGDGIGIGDETASTAGMPPLTPTPPHFRIPITDRFNYASVDCSARVHTAHRSAKSPSAILTGAKDRYMLTPCSTPPGENTFVVVELCDDIRIDTVQLANFEFFSGVFREFSVSVARTYTTDSEGWTFAGTYHAKNIRGIQSFHPPTSLRDFYRFIRIDFLSYFGNEYYCPVSLLRVYGLTHLEQWKWEEWEAEAQKKIMIEAEDVARSVSFPIYEFAQGSGETAYEMSKLVVSTMGDNTTESETTQGQRSPSGATQYATTSKSSVEPSAQPQGAYEAQRISANVNNGHLPSDVPVPLSSSLSASNTDNASHSSSSQEFSARSSHNSDSTIPGSALPVHSSFSSGSSNNKTVPSLSSSSSSPSSSYSQPNIKPASSYHSGSSMPVMSTVAPHEARSSHSISVASAGESIYRQIMTRLSILEMNSTLHLRYVEEQARSMRDVLRRLEEDIGRLEGVGKAQAQFIQRTSQEWERQRRRLEREHGELLARVNFLADEVVLEKRLGIAQLSLLLVVLIFMALTRGSRGEATTVVPGRHNSLREWGSRQLKSFGSGDWRSRLRRLSLTPTPMSRTRPERNLDRATAIKLSAIQPYGDDEFTLRRRGSPVRSSASKPRSLASIRTPHSRHIASASESGSGIAGSYLERPRLHLCRSNSHTSAAGDGIVFSHSFSGGFSPLSVKKRAKSAHLHEIRRGRNTAAGAGAGSKVHSKERRREGVPLPVYADFGNVSASGAGAMPSKDRRHKYLLSTPPDSTDLGRGYGLARGREGREVDLMDESDTEKVLHMSSLENQLRNDTQSLQVASGEEDEDVKVKEEQGYRDVVLPRPSWLFDDMKDTRHIIRNDIDAESENWVDTDVELSDFS